MNLVVNVAPDISSALASKKGSSLNKAPYSFTSPPKPSWERPKYRPPPLPDDNIPYGNIMYDRRVVRGPTYLHQPVPTQTAESQAARQAEARRRSMARRKAQSQRARSLRYRLGTPPPVEGRKHQNLQTQDYLEELFDNPPEVNEYTQTDFFLDRPPTPTFEQVNTGVDAATQIFPGELFHFDTEVRPVLEVLVGKTIEQSLMEVFEEEETAAIREQQKRLRENRQLELEEQQRLQEAENRRKQQIEERIFEQAEAAVDQKETESRVAAAVLTTGYIADLLPSVMQGLKDAGYLYEDVKDDMEGEFMDWLIKEVKTEMQRMVENRDLLSDMLRDILSTRAELYRAMGEKAAAKRGADSEEDLTPSESVITSRPEESVGEEMRSEGSLRAEEQELNETFHHSLKFSNAASIFTTEMQGIFLGLKNSPLKSNRYSLGELGEIKYEIISIHFMVPIYRIRLKFTFKFPFACKENQK